MTHERDEDRSIFMPTNALTTYIGIGTFWAAALCYIIGQSHDSSTTTDTDHAKELL